MKRFRFSLEALLTVRRRAEQNALEKYASALLARQRNLELLGAVHREQSQWWARWRNDLSKGCSAGDLMQWRASDRHLSEQRQRAEAAVSQAELHVNQALQEMLVARRDREAVENHWHKQRSKYDFDLSREEQKGMDELAQRRVPPALSGARTQQTFS